MPEPHLELLDAAIGHLRELKARGVRHVPVSAETIALLDRDIPKHGAHRRASAGSHRVTPAAADPLPSSPRISAPASDAPAEASARPTPKPASLPPLPVLPAPLPASNSVDFKATALEALAVRLSSCTKCAHLATTRTNIVFGVGNPDADIMFVGEAPGEDEDRQGEPFVGKAGQLLTRIIQTMGLSRDSVYIANILKCRPDMPPGATGNRKPTPEEMQTCISHLHEQIDIIQPKVLVALGVTAVEGLLGKCEGITRLRGNWREYRGIPLMPTYHPAYLLRNQSLSEKRKVWEDMLKVMTKLGMPISDKQRNYFLKPAS